MVICSLLPISMEKTHDPKEPACFADSLKDHAACYVVSFGDHVPYLRVLAPRTSEKTSRLKFAVEAVEMRLKLFQPLFQPHFNRFNRDIMLYASW